MAFKRSRVRFPSAPPVLSLRSLIGGPEATRAFATPAAPLGNDSLLESEQTARPESLADPKRLGGSRRLRRRSATIPCSSPSRLPGLSHWRTRSDSGVRDACGAARLQFLAGWSVAGWLGCHWRLAWLELPSKPTNSKLSFESLKASFSAAARGTMLTSAPVSSSIGTSVTASLRSEPRRVTRATGAGGSNCSAS